jgi:hypothetical protein
MSASIGQQVYEILIEHLSEITSKIILREKCKSIGKTPESLTKEDLESLIPLIMGPVLLFGGKAKSEKIKERLESLR